MPSPPQNKILATPLPYEKKWVGPHLTITLPASQTRREGKKISSSFNKFITLSLLHMMSRFFWQIWVCVCGWEKAWQFQRLLRLNFQPFSSRRPWKNKKVWNWILPTCLFFSQWVVNVGTWEALSYIQGYDPYLVTILGRIKNCSILKFPPFPTLCQIYIKFKIILAIDKQPFVLRTLVETLVSHNCVILIAQSLAYVGRPASKSSVTDWIPCKWGERANHSVCKREEERWFWLASLIPSFFKIRLHTPCHCHLVSTPSNCSWKFDETQHCFKLQSRSNNKSSYLN